MNKARLAWVLSLIALALAVAAAILNTINNGRITAKSVLGVLVFVALAVATRFMPGREPRTGEKLSE